jgi:putative oxidoreductase
MTRQLLRWGVRAGFFALFLWAGSAKLLDPSAFAQDISHYRVLPDKLVPALAVGLPVLECVVALALLTRTYLRGAASLGAGMLALFACAMAQAKLRGIDLDCGCFGREIADPVSWTKVALNAGLAMLAGWIAWSAHDSVPALRQSPSEAAKRT